ncbi:tripartite tricarboxylate transporter substrate-binding protein [Bordetella bronchialis]|uniref:tripartite tricarboxylate transporter substrate-binding protein n=1 Tax=Bordetella bronchialis TaxID=463025 RepID=UPI000B1C0F2B|nr:tripartite tricarboxylate transporter substrate-binding protein [Bordetella bronchialis]
MQLSRLEFAALALIGSTIPMEGYAGEVGGTFPNRPITLVVGYATGGGADTLARLLAERMAQDLQQKVVVENRPGAASSIAAGSVARAAGDGYTLYVSTHPTPPRAAAADDAGAGGNSCVAAHERDAGGLVPIALLATVPNVLVVGPQAPISDIDTLVTLAKTYPRMLSFGSPGVGSPPHLLGELFLRRTQTELLHVPYRGGALAIPEVIAGRVDVLFISLPGALPHLRAGTVRGLAIMSRQRATAIDTIPTMEEAGVPGIDLETRFGLMAPPGTPPHVIARLNESVNAALMNATLQEAFVARGYVVPGGPNTPELFKALVAGEAGKWGAIAPGGGVTGN